MLKYLNIMGKIVNSIIKIIDKYILSLACIFLGLFVRKSLIKEPKNIIIIKLWAMGDSINTLPLIKKIKDRYPKTRIDVLATKSNMSIYQGQDFINKVITLNPRILMNFKKYDLAIDFEPYLNISAVLSFLLARKRIGFNGKTRAMLYNATGQFYKDKHITVSYLSILKTFMNPNKRIELLKIKYHNNAKRKVEGLIKKLKIRKPIIGLCPSVGTEVKEREWQKFKYLADKITQNKCSTILIGTNSDRDKYDKIKSGNKNIYNMAGMLSIEELSYLMEKMDVFVSNDTGPMHLAAAQGVPTIGLFGPNTPKIWAPLGRKCISIFHPKPGCPFIDNTSHRLTPLILTEEQKTCMDTITVDEVYDAIMKLLKYEREY